MQVTQDSVCRRLRPVGQRPARLVPLLCVLGLLAVDATTLAAKPRRGGPVGPAQRGAATAPPVAANPELEAAHAALQAGRPVEAHDRLRRWLAQGGNESGLSPAQIEKLQAIRAVALPAVGDVAVSGEPGTEVRIDGQLLAQLPLPAPLLLSAGPHQVALAGRGGSLSAQIQVRAGRRLDVRESREAGAVLISQPPQALFGAAGDDLRKSASQGLQGTQLYLIPSPSELQSKLAECGERPACLRDIAQAQDVEYILLAQASPASPPRAPASPSPAASTDSGPAATSTLLLRAVLFDARVADQAAAAQQTCASCSAEEIGNRLRDLVAQVATTGLSRPRGQLRIECEPAEAELQLNGRVLGTGAVERAVWSGEAAIVASLAGYRPQQLRRFVAEGAQETVRVRLEKLPPPPPVVAQVPERPASPPARERAPRPLWRILAGSTALVAGGLLIGFGAGAQSVNGLCIDAVEPPSNQCSRLYQTATLGTALIVSGAVAATAGVVLLAVPGPQRPQRVAREGP